VTGAAGRFFEDFRVGEELRHATPRTVTAGDVALYTALTGSRFALHSADTFAQACGLPAAPVDDLLVFHIVFGKTVPDVSQNAVANLGYADGRWGVPVYPGDTLKAVSMVIGKRELSNGRTGIVWVETLGTNQRDETVLDYVRWVMVNKRDAASAAPEPEIPTLPEAVAPRTLQVPADFDVAGYDTQAAGDGRLWDDVAKGERIDHADGMAIEEAEHQLATRLYQNTAKVHFDLHRAAESRFGRRIVYGGHVISLARALSFNGLANACRIVGLNGGRHTAPAFAGDTVYAWSEIVEKAELSRYPALGAVRIRTVAAKNHPCADFPDEGEDGKDHPDKVLDLDYWALMPRRR
jgi:2-methylfumaryl-CoA hydratase